MGESVRNFCAPSSQRPSADLHPVIGPGSSDVEDADNRFQRNGETTSTRFGDPRVAEAPPRHGERQAVEMDEQATTDWISFEIDVRGDVDARLLETLRDMLDVTATTMTVTVLAGSAPDQAALLSVLQRLRAENLAVEAVRRLPSAFSSAEGEQ